MGSFAEQDMKGVSRMVIFRSRSEGRVRVAMMAGTEQPARRHIIAGDFKAWKDEMVVNVTRRL